MWKVSFYHDARGRSPVIEYLDGLVARDRARVARYLELVREFGPRLAMPHARHLDGGLWELRPGAHRVIYAAVASERVVLLHAFRKKSQKTPRREIERARRCLAELEARGGC
jgi:phage-related protein